MWLLYSHYAGNLFFFWHVLKACLWGKKKKYLANICPISGFPVFNPALREVLKLLAALLPGSLSCRLPWRVFGNLWFMAVWKLVHCLQNWQFWRYFIPWVWALGRDHGSWDQRPPCFMSSWRGAVSCVGISCGACSMLITQFDKESKSSLT